MSSFNLLKEDPLVATNFFLEVSGEVISNLTSIDGIAVELEKLDINQRTSKGQLVQHVAYSKPKWTGEFTVKRLSPLTSANDPLWKWFMTIRDKGMSADNRNQGRKSGSLVVYDSTLKEISRWNFTEAWPSKISVDSFDVTKNDPVEESITFQYESLTRVK